jgi:hypothetical protein
MDDLLTPDEIQAELDEHYETVSIHPSRGLLEPLPLDDGAEVEGEAEDEDELL